MLSLLSNGIVLTDVVCNVGFVQFSTGPTTCSFDLTFTKETILLLFLSLLLLSIRLLVIEADDVELQHILVWQSVTIVDSFSVVGWVDKISRSVMLQCWSKAKLLWEFELFLFKSLLLLKWIWLILSWLSINDNDDKHGTSFVVSVGDDGVDADDNPSSRNRSRLNTLSVPLALFSFTLNKEKTLKMKFILV